MRVLTMMLGRGQRREYGYLDEDDTVEQNVKAAKNGNNVVTTIDITLQSNCGKIHSTVQ